MFANQVVVPPYEDPLVWVFAFVAIWAEVGTVIALMRRTQASARGLWGPLAGINITTWFVFLIAVDRAHRWLDVHMVVVIGALELLVVLVEMVLLHSATRGRLFTRHLRCTPISWRQALLVSFTGNLVSVVVSIAVPAATLLLLTWRFR